MTAVDDRRSHPALPHPRRRLPVLGDVLAFRAESPAQSTLQLAKLGSVFEFRFLGARYVVAAGADAVVELSDESRFCKHVGPDIEALRLLGGDGLFTAYNDEPNWQKAHDVLMPAFSQQAMRRYHAVMFDVADELTDRWDAHAARGETVDVSADATRVTSSRVCTSTRRFSRTTARARRPSGRAQCPLVAAHARDPTVVVGALVPVHVQNLGMRQHQKPVLPNRINGQRGDR